MRQPYTGETTSEPANSAHFQVKPLSSTSKMNLVFYIDESTAIVTVIIITITIAVDSLIKKKRKIYLVS